MGKEVFANMIHALSPRRHKPFIAVNCAAIPEGTIDSELFGHEKGAFTGAIESREGYFEYANGGTIFLDEVSEMPLGTQAKLLRVLETGEFMRVGSSRVRKTDVRVIAATNKNLEELVKDGHFREDLYYRITIVVIHIPPLRERGQDIIWLFKKFALDFADKYGTEPLRLTDEAKDLLLRYSWPGNVRQLKHIVEQLTALSPTRIVTPELLKEVLPDIDMPPLPVQVKDSTPPLPKDSIVLSRETVPTSALVHFLLDLRGELQHMKEMLIDLSQGIKTLLSHIAIQSLPPSSHPEKQENTSPEEQIFNKPMTLEEMEKLMIISALKRHKGRRKEAAQELGISERTLYRKIKEYGIDL